MKNQLVDTQRNLNYLVPACVSLPCMCQHRKCFLWRWDKQSKELGFHSTSISKDSCWRKFQFDVIFGTLEKDRSLFLSIRLGQENFNDFKNESVTMHAQIEKHLKFFQGDFTHSFPVSHIPVNILCHTHPPTPTLLSSRC